LGVALQKARMDRGITQEDLAHRAGLTRTHYQQIERGFWKQGSPSNPSIKVVVRLAQVLEMEPGDLLPAVAVVGWPTELDKP
jgi:transcriptional regulator with XRE-family HTH domain